MEYGFCISKPACAGRSSAVLLSPPAASEPVEQSVPDAGHFRYRNDSHGSSGNRSRQPLPIIFHPVAVASEYVVFRRVYCQVPGVFPADNRSAEAGPYRIFGEKVSDVSGFPRQ
ncbi:MAG: hypothetical protein K6E17_08610 [Clostridiales bacterium]|nr:hypothetical protein [Clostridiales bacterium]